MLSRSTSRAEVPSPDQPRSLVLFHYDTCPYCGRVFHAIASLGLQSDVQMRDIFEEPEARRELVAATGRSTVPCLFIDGVPLHESLDIVAWLKRYATEARRPA